MHPFPFSCTGLYNQVVVCPVVPLLALDRLCGGHISHGSNSRGRLALTTPSRMRILDELLVWEPVGLKEAGDLDLGPDTGDPVALTQQ